MRNIIFIAIFSLISLPAHAYQWPIDPFDNDPPQHRVTATLGEYRQTYTSNGRTIPEHLHEGIDISAEGGTLVFSVAGTPEQPDVVEEVGSISVTTKNQFRYVHIIRNVEVGSRLIAGKTVIEK